MAIPRIKATYTLDVETIRALEKMALCWKVSKSEALRRAIRAAGENHGSNRRDSLEALDRLQKSLGLTPDKAQIWAKRAREERRASSTRPKTGDR